MQDDQMYEIQIGIDNEAVVVPEFKDVDEIMVRSLHDTHGILEIVSAKFHCLMVFQKGTFKINTNYGKIEGGIKRGMNVVQEYGSVGFHLRYAKIPQIGFSSLQKTSVSFHDIDISGVPRMEFNLKNVLVHFDDESSIKTVLNRRQTCSFTYRSEFTVSVSITCVQFPERRINYKLHRYFGMEEIYIRGGFRNEYGVVKEAMEFSPEIVAMYRHINENGLDVEDNIVVGKINGKKQPVPYYFSDITRRDFPYGVFELKTDKYTSKKVNTVQLLYTTGYRTKSGIEAFVCPISGHTSFTLKLGSSVRIFNSFSKFVKNLSKWSHPCHATAKFRLYHHNTAPSISLWFNYNPLIVGKGEIKLQFWDMYETLMNSYVCSVEHLCGVFNKKASVSVDSNVHNRIDWADRYHCPHEDACPRNCAAWISPLEGDNDRVPIPKAIPCKCVGYGGFIPIVSKFHYYIELGKELPLELGGMFSYMIKDYVKNPEMYKDSKLSVLLNGNHDVLYHIETFLFGRQKK